MSSDTFRVWLKDQEGDGMTFLLEIPERDAALVLATCKAILCGRSIILT